jgi:hypothetical protein
MDSACSLILPDAQMYRNSSKMVQLLFNGHTCKRLDCKPMTSKNVQSESISMFEMRDPKFSSQLWVILLMGKPMVTKGPQFKKPTNLGA